MSIWGIFFTIPTDDTKCCFIEKNKKKNVTNLHQIFLTRWSNGIIMIAKIKMRQYAIFIQPQNLIPQISSVLQCREV